MKRILYVALFFISAIAVSIKAETWIWLQNHTGSPLKYTMNGSKGIVPINSRNQISLIHGLGINPNDNIRSLFVESTLSKQNLMDAVIFIYDNYRQHKGFDPVINIETKGSGFQKKWIFNVTWEPRFESNSYEDFNIK